MATEIDTSVVKLYEAETSFYKAEEYYDMGELERAAEQYKKALDLYGRIEVPKIWDKEKECRVKIGEISVLQDKQEEASRYFKEAKEIKKKSGSVRVGRLYLDSGKKFRDRRIIQEAGDILFEQKDFSQAAEAFRRSGELSKADEEIQTAAGLFEKAAESYLSGKPVDYEGASRMRSEVAAIYEEASDWENASRSYESAGECYLALFRKPPFAALEKKGTKLIGAKKKEIRRSYREEAEGSFRKAKLCYGSAGKYADATRLRLMEIRTRRRGRSFPSRILSRILLDWTSNYGESPLRVLMTAIVIIVVFAYGFHVLPNVQWQWPVDWDVFKMTTAKQVLDNLYLSASSFVTAAPLGDVFSSTWVRYISLVESFLGPFCFALFLFTIYRRFFLK